MSKTMKQGQQCRCLAHYSCTRVEGFLNTQHTSYHDRRHSLPKKLLWPSQPLDHSFHIEALSKPSQSTRSYLDGLSELSLISGREELFKGSSNLVLQLFSGQLLGGRRGRLGRGRGGNSPLSLRTRASACRPTPVIPVTPHPPFINQTHRPSLDTRWAHQHFQLVALRELLAGMTPVDMTGCFALVARTQKAHSHVYWCILSSQLMTYMLLHPGNNLLK